jgi:hypothetical protein
VSIGVVRCLGLMGALLTGSAVRVAAQSAGQSPDVPAAYIPPAGMCRVWLKDVPPMQQPAPTDCPSAVRTKPVNATVVYGPESRRSPYSATDWTRATPRTARDDDPGSNEGCADGARCDDAMAMPAMRSAVIWIEGQRSADMQRWFGAQNVAARFTPPARGASPDRVQWYDLDGHLVQSWIDRNGDGRADRVEIFNRDGTRVKVIGQ